MGIRKSVACCCMRVAWHRYGVVAQQNHESQKLLCMEVGSTDEVRAQKRATFVQQACRRCSPHHTSPAQDASVGSAALVLLQITKPIPGLRESPIPVQPPSHVAVHRIPFARRPARERAIVNSVSPRPRRAFPFQKHIDALGVASPALWWSLLYFYCLLTGYYILRPVRDAMGALSRAELGAAFPVPMIEWFARQGWDLSTLILQVLFTATFICMLLLQPLYGLLVSRFARRVFLPVVYLAFIACLIGFHWAFKHEMPGRGAIFFVWAAVFNLFAVSVFWSYMADIFEQEDAKRLYGYIGAGGTLGALTGPGIASALVERIGVSNLLLVSVAFLGLCLLCILQLRPWAQRREQARNEAGGERAMGGGMLAGLSLIVRDPLLRALALLMFFAVGVGTLLYNEQAAIARQLSGDDARTAYFARIDLTVNLLTLLIQMFATGWLLRRFGIAPLLLLPATAILLGFALLSASPLPMLIWGVQVMTRASEFSLAKPARETLYTQVSREARYKAKAAIDTVVYRSGDLSFVWLHKWLVGFGSGIVFLAGIGVALAMGLSAWAVVRAQPRPARARAAAGQSQV